MTELCEKHGDAHTVLYPGIQDSERCELCVAIARGKSAAHLLVWLWDNGHIVAAHEPDCPEDDTCECYVAQTIKATIARALRAR